MKVIPATKGPASYCSFRGRGDFRTRKHLRVQLSRMMQRDGNRAALAGKENILFGPVFPGRG